MSFNAGLEIGVCRRVEKYFPARLPSEGRSERDVLVGVLVGRNRGRQKKLPATGYSDDDCGFREAS